MEPAAKRPLPTFKAAVPLAGGMLGNHFGHCEQFAIMEVLEGRIGSLEFFTPPPPRAGGFAPMAGELGVCLIIAGGMGQRALNFFTQGGIKVITGAPNLGPEALVNRYLSGTLVSGPNVCDH